MDSISFSQFVENQMVAWIRHLESNKKLAYGVAQSGPRAVFAIKSPSDTQPESAVSVDVSTDAKERALFESFRGTIVLRRIVVNSRYLPMEPSDLQTIMQNSMLRSLVPILYKTDFKTHKALIFKRLGLSMANARSKVAISCPRRFGKSVGVAMIVALALCHMEGVKVMVISTGDRIAKAFVKLVYANMPRIPGASPATRVTEKGMRVEIESVVDGAGVMNELISVPAVEDTVRGTTAQWIIVDEAAFVEPGVFDNVVYPLCSVNDSCLVCISSPPKEADNSFNAMFEKKLPNGSLVFEVVRVSTMCAACIEARRVACPHIADPRPHWQSDEGIEELRALMSGNAFRREIAGSGENDDIKAFNMIDITHVFKTWKALYTAQPVRPPAQVANPVRPAYDFIFVGMDPSGGGTNSRTAITAFAFEPDDTITILALRNIDIRNASTNEQIIELLVVLTALRAVHKRAQFVAVVEADYNPSFCHDVRQHLDGRRASIGRVVYLYESVTNPDLPGVFKSDNGDGYQRAFNVFLRTKRVRIEVGAGTCTTEETVNSLEDQLRAYKLNFTKSSERSVRAAKPVWSGKSSGPDDLVVCLLMTVYFAVKFLIDDKYSQTRPGFPSRIVRGMSTHAIGRKFGSERMIEHDRVHASAAGFDPKDSIVSRILSTFIVS